MKNDFIREGFRHNPKQFKTSLVGVMIIIGKKMELEIENNLNFGNEDNIHCFQVLQQNAEGLVHLESVSVVVSHNSSPVIGRHWPEFNKPVLQFRQLYSTVCDGCV